jgi:hypothetical protein
MAGHQLRPPAEEVSNQATTMNSTHGTKTAWPCTVLRQLNRATQQLVIDEMAIFDGDRGDWKNEL